MSLGVSSGDLIGSWSLSFSDIAFVTGKAEKPPPSLPLRRIAPCVYRLTR